MSFPQSDVENKYAKHKAKMAPVTVDSSDDTYVYGTMYKYSDEDDGNLYYFSKAEESDPEGSYTEYNQHMQLFIVYDNCDNLNDGIGTCYVNNIIRIVLCVGSWSDDYVRWDFNNGELTQIIETEHGMRRATKHYQNGKCTSINMIGNPFGYYTCKKHIDSVINSDAMSVTEILDRIHINKYGPVKDSLR